MNTKYFHSVIKWRRARNGINGLRENGQWVEGQAKVKEKVRDFFQQQFESGVYKHVRFNRIIEEDNDMLVGRISEEKIKQAVWCCDSDKSPGPDGFNFGCI